MYRQVMYNNTALQHSHENNVRYATKHASFTIKRHFPVNNVTIKLVCIWEVTNRCWWHGTSRRWVGLSLRRRCDWDPTKSLCHTADWTPDIKHRLATVTTVQFSLVR